MGWHPGREDRDAETRMGVVMTEREAFYAAIEAEPDNWLTYGVLADWLEDRGEVELADGYRAMMRLRVCVEKRRDYRRFAPLDSYHDNGRSLHTARSIGRFYFVTDSWREESRYEWPKQAVPPYGESLDDAARAYSRLTPKQKAEAERLLAPAEVLA